ncbi:hypothetical protein H2201_002209 [Coniosporium apollinis]|uniref:Phosphoglycerate mutase n=1 Tax=Coniosporium apollinis TaxID=61459 RepID=A0ABQ9NZ77_9PEZI|nr:hypothetical protein H2201_002209 [Coniosporium apollinis]
MPRAPAVIVIARHGARLDAADKTWHLTSPAPYDPPLTYGGWTQSKALGTRIASLLHEREQASGENRPEAASSDGLDSFDFGALDGPTASKDQPRGRSSMKRKYQVVMHSSPFLRCVQTSVAISAGIAQFQTSPARSRERSVSSENRRERLQPPGSPRQRAAEGRSPALAPILEPDHESTPAVIRRSLKRKGIRKSLLRIDAFLGEWLSPEYFDLITPPPNSVMMVAAAKAELLRREEHMDAPQNIGNLKGYFPGGWVKTGGATTPVSNGRNTPVEEGPLADISSLGHALPRRDRASSHSSVDSAGSRHGQRSTLTVSTSTIVDNSIYQPPIPTYALGGSEPIPRGYVAHARDACVDVDYKWDSMREPQNWPDGGEYGEEWSHMHKRFRKGLNEMILWYKKHGLQRPVDEDEVVTHTQDDEDTDIVLVLVTHGAGCNALIGGLTNQPVLLDVGMASLTMAVRKDSVDRKALVDSTNGSNGHPYRRRSSIDLGLSSEYEMKLVASSDHLRSGADSAKMSALRSPKLVAHIPEYRRRFGSQAGSPVESPLSIGEPMRSMNSALGSIKRSSTTGAASATAPRSPITTGRNTPSSSMSGLWNSPRLEGLPEASSSLGREVVWSAGGDTATDVEQSKLPPPAADEKENDVLAPLPPPNHRRSVTQHGLWGSVPSGDRNERDKGPKRRWTIVNE